MVKVTTMLSFEIWLIYAFCVSLPPFFDPTEVFLPSVLLVPPLLEDPASLLDEALWCPPVPKGMKNVIHSL